MTSLWLLVLDGPCIGSYTVRRATKSMVFTVDRTSGERFVLDEEGDVVTPAEDAYVYEMTGSVGHVCGSGKDLPAQTVSYQYAGQLVRETGEFIPATEPELAEIRRVGHERVIAMARETIDGGRSSRKSPTPEPVQEALF